MHSSCFEVFAKFNIQIHLESISTVFFFFFLLTVNDIVPILCMSNFWLKIRHFRQHIVVSLDFVVF